MRTSGRLILFFCASYLVADPRGLRPAPAWSTGSSPWNSPRRCYWLRSSRSCPPAKCRPHAGPGSPWWRIVLKQKRGDAKQTSEVPISMTSIQSVSNNKSHQTLFNTASAGDAACDNPQLPMAKEADVVSLLLTPNTKLHLVANCLIAIYYLLHPTRKHASSELRTTSLLGFDHIPKPHALFMERI